MKKSTSIVLICLALAIGCAVGGGVTFYLGARFVSNASATAETAEVTLSIRSLQRLRADDVNGAVELLEARLDGALISMDSFLAVASEKGRDEKAIQTLRLAQSYRQKYPRKTSLPQVDQAVAKVLGSVGN